MDARKAARVSGESKAGEGAGIGAGVGAAFGGLAAVAAGAAGGGLVGALIGHDFPEEEARFYESELKAGRVLVGVKADERYTEVAEILQRFGGYDRAGV